MSRVAGDQTLETAGKRLDEHVGERMLGSGARTLLCDASVPKTVSRFCVPPSPRFLPINAERVQEVLLRRIIAEERRSQFDVRNRTNHEAVWEVAGETTKRSRREADVVRGNVQKDGGVNDPRHAA